MQDTIYILMAVAFGFFLGVIKKKELAKQIVQEVSKEFNEGIEFSSPKYKSSVISTDEVLLEKEQKEEEKPLTLEEILARQE